MSLTWPSCNERREGNLEGAARPQPAVGFLDLTGGVFDRGVGGGVGDAGALSTGTMTLRILPLADFERGREASRQASIRTAAQLDRDAPGWRDWLNELPPVASPLVERDPSWPHHIQWWPFTGQGRHSSNGTWHVCWGKVDNEAYRVALCLNDELRLWLEPSVRVVDAWVADNGYFVLKDYSGDDDVTFAFADNEGCIFHHWTRPWRFLTFLSFDADGMGYAYADDHGRTEVRFENASLGE